MLELEMGLDADLGIDSIKRVEILSAIQERNPALPVVKPEHLGQLQTLQAVVDFLSAPTQSPAPSPSPSPSPSPAPSAGPALDRWVLRRESFATPAGGPAVAADCEVWITGRDASLAAALEAELSGAGYAVRLQPLAEVGEWSIPTRLGGLIVLAPAAGTDDLFLLDAFLAAQRVGPALRQAGSHGGAVFATVSRLDGGFGLAEFGAAGEPLSGGMAGLAKTLHHEWPEVTSRALDLGGDLQDAAAAARAIVGALGGDTPVELGLTARGVQTLRLQAEQAPELNGHAPLQQGDVVLVTGGARGVTADAALALAQAWRPTLVLCGRSPLPEPEPAWLSALSDETAIKRELFARANGSANPKAIGEAYARIAAQREMRANIARLEATGSQVIYRPLDVRDGAAVTAFVQELRREFANGRRIRGVVHGAGVLADSLVEAKTADQFERVYQTKVNGCRALLDALADEELRFVALFSSSTGRFGRKGQADYAVANEVLNKLAQRESRRRPGCRVVSLNWGPWAGGMVTPSLEKLFAEEGVAVIQPDRGGEFLVRELSAPGGSDVEVVVLGAGSAVETPVSRAANGHGAPGGRGARPAASPALPVALERELSVAQCPFLASHVIDGRAVLPMAMAMEWLAHGALHGNPGLAFHGFDECRLLKGVTLGADDVVPLRIHAGKASKADGAFVVPVELWSVAADGRETLHVRAKALLTDGHPEAPAAAILDALEPFATTRSEIYGTQLFHGPDFQGIETVAGCDARGIDAAIRRAPAPGDWVTNPGRTAWVTGPLAVDCAFQLVILWCLEHQGAASLPTFAARYRQYRRDFPDTGVRVAIRVTRASGHQATADVEMTDAGGSVVARLEGYECVIEPALRGAFERNQISGISRSAE
jgi:NAD(P)-dependent dehydrogenase (short-subunit alcohol dehydrogenase family)